MYELIYKNEALSFTLNSDSGLYQANPIIDYQFTSGIYTIIWDKMRYVEYNTYDSSLRLGNTDLSYGYKPEENGVYGGEPFYLNFTTNEFKIITESDLSTHSIEIYKGQFLPVNCLMYENQICFGNVNRLDPGPTCKNNSRPNLNLKEGYQYTVLWNNASYTCIAQQLELSIDNSTFIAMSLGNTALNEGFSNIESTSNEPFLYFEILGYIQNEEIVYYDQENMINQQFNISSNTDNIVQNFTVSVYKGIYDKHWLVKDVEVSFEYNEEFSLYMHNSKTNDNGETWYNIQNELLENYSPILIESFIPGEVYTIIWDDKKYTCTAMDTENVGACGNLALINEGYPTGEPFGFIVNIVDDQFTIMLFTLDLSSTHTISIYKGAQKPIFEDAHLDNNFMADMAPGGNCLVLMGDQSMKLDHEYTVVVDGETYTLEAFSGSFAGYDVIGIGNPAAIGAGEDNGIPFGCGTLFQSDMTMFMLMMVDPDARTEQHIASLYEGPTPISTVKINAVVNDKNGNPKIYENIKTLSINTDDNKIATFVLESIKEE